MVRRKGRSKLAKSAAKGRLGMGFRKKGKKSNKNDEGDLLDQQEREIEKIKKQAAQELHDKDLARQPHTLVIHRGKVGKYLKALEHDLRNIMSPNTAPNLKIRKNNNIKDFVVNGAVLGVTNLMVLTLGDNSAQLRMIRFSQGPTLTFRLKQYSIARHILSAQKRPVIYEKLFQRLPLVIMNGFNQEKRHLQLVQTYIQNMFPTLNVDKLDLRDVKRCLMVNYNEADDTVDIRHYALRVVASGLSKSTKKLLKAQNSSTKGIPDLSRYKDISEFLLNPGQLSDSEFEGEQQEVELPQDINTKGGCITGQKSNVRLMEIGPRLTLELLKIEEGIDEGEVLYHKFIEKSNEEILNTRKKAPLLKKQRKQREKDEQHRIIRRLTAVQEGKEREESEVKSIIEKAARQQAAATGQSEDIENQREKDREIALNRERETKEEEAGGRTFKRRGRYEDEDSGGKRGRFGGDENDDDDDGDDDDDSGRPPFRRGGGDRGRPFRRGGFDDSRGRPFRRGGFDDSRGGRSFGRGRGDSRGGRSFSRGGGDDFRGGRSFSRGGGDDFRGGRSFSRGGGDDFRGGRSFGRGGGDSRGGRSFSRGGGDDFRGGRSFGRGGGDSRGGRSFSRGGGDDFRGGRSFSRGRGDSRGGRSFGRGGGGRGGGMRGGRGGSRGGPRR